MNEFVDFALRTLSGSSFHDLPTRNLTPSPRPYHHKSLPPPCVFCLLCLPCRFRLSFRFRFLVLSLLGREVLRDKHSSRPLFLREKSRFPEYPRSHLVIRHLYDQWPWFRTLLPLPSSSKLHHNFPFYLHSDLLHHIHHLLGFSFLPFCCVILLRLFEPIDADITAIFFPHRQL